MKSLNKIFVGFCILFTCSCYHEGDYLPANVNPDNIIISLAPENSQLPADGQSYTYVNAELPIDAIDSRSTIMFTTTRGTFDNNLKTITVQATLVNVGGTNRRIAKVRLISSSTIETAEISATVENVTKKTVVTFTNLAFDTFLSLSSSGDVAADGASFSIVNVEQPIDLSTDYSSITFTTTAGSFDNGTKTITKSSATILQNGTYKKIAQVRLIASKMVETATVEAAIKGTSKIININFKNAYPENIKLNVGALNLSLGYSNSTTIAVNMTRAVGIPSLNNVANVTIRDASLKDHGNFINPTNLSDATGVVTNRFTMGDDPYQGPLKITATSKDANGKILTDSTIITIKP